MPELGIISTGIEYIGVILHNNPKNNKLFKNKFFFTILIAYILFFVRKSICFQFPKNSFVQFPKNFHNF